MDAMKKLCYLSEVNAIEELLDDFEIYNCRDWGEGIALNVKIHCLSLTDDENEVAYNVINDNEIGEMFYQDMGKCIDRFEETTGHTAVFTGRSGGHLLLLDGKTSSAYKKAYTIDIDNITDDSADDEDNDFYYEINDIINMKNLLIEFKNLYNEMLEVLKFYCENYKELKDKHF